MATPPPPDPLSAALRRTETELSERLHEACEAENKPLSDESTGRLMRLKDSLLSAAEAAEEVVELRLTRRQLTPAGGRPAERARPTGGEREVADSSAGPADVQGGGVREFPDSAGRQWRAWAVTPGQTLPLRGEFEKGWLAFEALDGTARRRLPEYPGDWATLDDAGLDRLLRQAVDVPQRRLGAGTSGAAHEPSE